MTNQEAIQQLKSLKSLIRDAQSHINGDESKEVVSSDAEALEKGIEALEFVDREWDRDTLENWYIDSVSEEDEPVWTTEHLDELCNDFHLIPKEVEDD